MEYVDFEGTIPPLQYGACTVMVWDRGQWVPDGDPKAGYNKGRLTFTLVGQTLRGRCSLVRMGGARNRDGKNLLLIKERDQNVSTDVAVTSPAWKIASRAGSPGDSPSWPCSLMKVQREGMGSRAEV